MKKLLTAVFCTMTLVGWSQSADYPLGHPAYTLLDYATVKSEKPFYTKFKPYARQKAGTYASMSSLSDFNRQYLAQDSREWSGDSTESKKPIGPFYRYPADMYAATAEGFDLHVNPVVHFRVGRESQGGGMLYENNRGMELRARIDNRIALYTMLSENQTLFPDYINQYRDTVGAIPYEGFWKRFGTNGSDFFRAEGYVDVGVTDHVSLQLGYGRHFIGDGQRSLILSDFSNRYPYIRIETEVWRVKYTNLFAQLVGEAAFVPTGNLGTREFPQKYLALHHLDISVTDNLNIGLFESVVFGEPDSLGGGVKLQYLNPIIFYRALEQQDGSPDNVLLGMDFNWHLWNRFTLYGQLVIDEMVVSEAFSGSGWWGNKQGFQLGGKYFDAFGVDRLMLQGELNTVRPFTYAHQNFFTNYTHYNMPLAHPLGANFREVIGKIDYQPFDKWRFQATGLFAQFGDDINGDNYGRNISRPYNNPVQQYGNTLLQGQKGTLQMINVRATCQFRPNLNIDGDIILRNQTGQTESQSTIFGLSMRWNFPERFYLF